MGYGIANILGLKQGASVAKDLQMADIKKGTKSEDFIPFRFSPTSSQSRRFDSPPLRSFTDSAFSCCVDTQAHRYLNLYLPGSLSLQLFSDAWLRPPASVSRLTLQRVRTVSACLSERVRRLVWHTLETLRFLRLSNFRCPLVTPGV